MQLRSRWSNQVTAQDVLKVIRRATRNARDELFGVVVRKLGEDAVYLYDRLNLDSDGRPQKFSVYELYKMYLSHPKEMFSDASRVNLVNELYWYRHEHAPIDDNRAEWMRKTIWPKMDKGDRLQLQEAAEFIMNRYYGFEWYPRKKDDLRYNLDAMSTLCALVWPLVEREQKWERKYRVVDDEPTQESAPVKPVLLLESGDKSNSVSEPEFDPKAGVRHRMETSWKKKQKW